MLVSEKPEVVHVGLHKTGTTYLQREFFPKINCRVLSNELLSGVPMFSSLNYMLKYNLRDYYADCIKKQYGDVKIIIGVRDPESLSKSLYSQYLKAGGNQPYIVWRRISLNESYLDYENYIRCLKLRFSDVHVYHFEDLNRCRGATLRFMCDFIGCSYPVDLIDGKRHNIGLYGLTAFKRWFYNNLQVFKRFINDRHSD